jgi:predicted dehydrogenase
MKPVSVGQPLRLGFVGGGAASSIGPMHWHASRFDATFQLVAGAFSADAQRNHAAGEAYGVAPERVYDSFEQMALAESRRTDGIEAVSVMLPNNRHVAATRAFLAHGIDVICEKPLATSLEEALSLEAFHAAHPGVVVLTHNYSGFPMIREARDQIAAGTIGELRLVQVEHAVSSGVAAPGKAAASGWRADPAVAGASAVLADVGVHAHHLLRFVTGLEVREVAAELATLSPGRISDDNAHVMMRLGRRVRGLMWASFVAAGIRQGLQIRVFGSTGSLAWHQEDPDRLVIQPQHAAHYVLRRGEAWTGAAAQAGTRLKAGQLEGQIEAFANIYSDAAELIRARRAGRSPAASACLCPTLADGVAGMRFIDGCVRSQAMRGAWVEL